VKCIGKPCFISGMSLELVLRDPKQDGAQNANEIRALNPKLVLRDVPGKSAQWWWQPERFRRPTLIPALLYPPRKKVVGMALPPRLLRLHAAGCLALRISASSLTGSNSWIGAEPPAANATRFLWSIGHGDPSSPHLNKESADQLFLSRIFLTSRGGSFLTSADAQFP
jgi:hypothetical protein